MKGVIMAVMQAEQLKLDSNLRFLKKSFGAAIEAYTEAISLCPDVANYLTSRALCHRKRNDWIRVEEDCKKAVQLDHNSVKIPEYLCCRITLDIFRDPVIAPSGLTYERSVILDHLHKVGMFDPITRRPLNPSQLVQNLAIKEAVQAFLDTNGWAYRMD